MSEISEHPELGPVLVERRCNIWPIKIGIALAVGCLLVLGVAFVMGKSNRTLDIAAFVLSYFGLMLIAIGISSPRFRLHQRGVSTGKNWLSFDEIESFIFTAKQRHEEGSYSGTWKTMSFFPYRSTQKPMIRLRYDIYDAAEPEVEQFRQRRLKQIRQRMLDQIEQDGKAVWIGGLTLRKEGLEYGSERGLPTVVAYQDLQAEAEQGFFKQKFILRDAAHDQIIAKLAMDTPNLSSGRAVISTLLKRQQASATA